MNSSVVLIGSLIKTKIGVYGVIKKFNSRDNLYTISWANGMRQGENVNYDKKIVDYLLQEGDWRQWTPKDTSC
jgi:hypothetical protein